MTKAEKQAIKARKENLMKQGVDEMLAGIMAKTEFECGIIKPVVNGNF